MNFAVKPKVEIRTATKDDAASITHVQITSWQEAYKNLMPQSYLDELPLTFKTRQKWWAQNLEFPQNGFSAWVAETIEHGVIGFSSVEQARDESFQGLGELTTIYLLKSYQSQGIGRRLLREALMHILKSGLKKAYCWVLHNNPTLHFYEHFGARKTDKIKRELIGSLEVTEVACMWDNLEVTLGPPV